MSTYKKFIQTLILLTTFSFVLNAQSSKDLQMKVVSLYQDVSLLTEQLGQLKLELESVRRENQQLIQELDENRKSQNQLVEGVNQFFENLEERLGRIETEVSKGNSNTDKNQIVTEVSAQINQLAVRTQEAIDVLAKSLDEVRMGKAKIKKSTHSNYSVSNENPTFNNDYPKNGIPYEVQSGDSLSKIASKYKSKVSYIINANRLANPNALQVGQTLFIPTTD